MIPPASRRALSLLGNLNPSLPVSLPYRGPCGTRRPPPERRCCRLVSPLNSDVLGGPGRPRRARTPELSVNGVRSRGRAFSCDRSAADSAADCLGPGGRGR
ncbi:hypothetical protein NDU88_006398 [Pleurodeles waltl]|uniref:Uncharacterized protein n=1 Tax=Pleurodeles waltl TaxID=8319 RepID=A0AAV7VQE2_PLEWA|nr:hypothetical protein NDU88_006398 [Pleurodeles waltl]